MVTPVWAGFCYFLPLGRGERWRFDRPGHDGGVTHTREISASPPANFPVYGLDASWAGARWLDGFGDRIGDEVRWLRLAHQDPATGAWIVVESFARELTNAQAEGLGEPPLQTVAFNASVVLVDITLPVLSVPRPAGFLRALVDNAAARSREHARWPLVSWRVDGADVDARAWRFAGGWAAVSDRVDGVYLAAAGTVGTEPDGLAFSGLSDGQAYHFDLGGWLHPRSMTVSKAATGDGERMPPQLQDWHADQRRLMDGAS